MPRAMWKGAISFGLVTIPVSVYPATEEKTLRFNQLHDEDGGRIRMKRTCSVDGEEVGYEHIVKGYEYEKDRYVILTDEDFEAVPVESSRAIDIQQFVDLEEIDPMMYKKSYYLVPEETGAKAYALLREALNRSGKVGVAKVSFRDKEHLAALRFRDEAFVLETMYWPDEIREADFGGVDVSAKVRPNELEMAQSLIDNLTADWDPAEFKDEYREAMLRIVEAKINGEEIEIVEAEPTAKVVDLMEALKASVAAAKKEVKAAPAAKKKAAGAEEDRGQEAGGQETRGEEAGGAQEGRRGVISRRPASRPGRPRRTTSRAWPASCRRSICTMRASWSPSAATSRTNGPTRSSTPKTTRCSGSRPTARSPRSPPAGGSSRRPRWRRGSTCTPCTGAWVSPPG